MQPEPDDRQAPAPLGPGHAARAGAWGCLSLVAAGLLAALVAALLSRTLGADEEVTQLAVALPLQSFLMVVISWLVTQDTQEGPVEALALGRWRGLWLAPSVLLVGLFSDQLVEALRLLRAPLLGGDSIAFLERAAQQPGLLGIAVILGAVVAAPVGEELLFRGAIYGGLRARFGVRWSVLLSALAFGAWHVDPLHAVGATALGLWLGWLRHATGSVWPCVLAHVLNNGLWAVLARSGGAPELPPWAPPVALQLALLLAWWVGRQAPDAQGEESDERETLK